MELFENLLGTDRWMFEDSFFFQVNMSGEKHPLTYLPSWGGKGGVGPILVEMYSAFFSGNVTPVILIPS